MKSINNRLLFNKAILNRLHFVVENNPDLRFGQILINCNILEFNEKENPEDVLTIKDCFNEESELVWNRMCKNEFSFPNERIFN